MGNTSVRWFFLRLGLVCSVPFWLPLYCTGVPMWFFYILDCRRRKTNRVWRNPFFQVIVANVFWVALAVALLMVPMWSVKWLITGRWYGCTTLRLVERWGLIKPTGSVAVW